MRSKQPNGENSTNCDSNTTTNTHLDNSAEIASCTGSGLHIGTQSSLLSTTATSSKQHQQLVCSTGSSNQQKVLSSSNSLLLRQNNNNNHSNSLSSRQLVINTPKISMTSMYDSETFEAMRPQSREVRPPVIKECLT